MAHDARTGLRTLPSAAGIVPSYLDAGQWTKAAMAIGRIAAQRLGGEGLLSGGLFTTGSNWPTFAAVVYDDAGEAWWLGATGNTAMTFTDTSGACTAYLVVKQMTGVSPAAAIGGRGDFQVVVQLTATTAPAHSLALGAGNVTASAFTTWTEATGVRLNDWTLGSGADVDVTLYADNGDANRPGLRYDASSNVWQFSHDGTTWSTIMAVGAAPTAHAASHNAGGGDALAIDAAAATGSLRTIGTGALQACAGNDARLSNSRTPTSHASTHNAGGGDALAIDAAAGTGSLRTLGTAATAACAGNDSRLSDTRDPKAHKTSHQNGGADEVATATAAANAIPKAGAGGTLDSGWLPATIASDRTFSGAVTASDRVKIIDGLLQRTAVADTNRSSALLGPPANSTGTASQVGDLWIDLAGAMWLCTTAGTPGTWKQMSPGSLELAGTRATLRATANWNGGALLNGYRVIEDTAQLWSYDSSLAVWKGPRQLYTMALDDDQLPISDVRTWWCAWPIPSVLDRMVVEKLTVIAETASGDASNYYTLGLLRYTGYTNILTTNIIRTANRARYESSASAVLLESATTPPLGWYWEFTKTGSPGNLTQLGAAVTWREAWA